MSRGLLGFSLAAALVVATAPARGGGEQRPPARSAQGGGAVKLQSVVKVYIAKDAPAYSISYEYAFPGLSAIHVAGLGVVPPVGAFHYITTLEQLTFEHPATREVLASPRLRETVVVAAKPPVTEIPNENDFSPAFRAFTWDARQSLLERANAILGRHFRYLPRESKDVTYLTTTFAPLPLRGVQEGVLGQVALLMSFPYPASAAGSFDFRVQSLVKEGRSHSDDYRPTNNPIFVKAADILVDQLIAEMTTMRRIQ
jgi:hypothetical protein